MKQKLIIATRGSRLALHQSEIVRDILLQKFPGTIIEFLEVTTTGDIDQTTPLSDFGNTGVFVKGLETKLLFGEADLAVHSLKDVPSESHPELILASFPQREDVCDVLVTKNGKTLNDLVAGSVIGTSSPGRQEQLKLLRPDLNFKSIRGNVNTRVKKVLNGEYDATILAAAGLLRLGYEIPEDNYFSLDEMIPSPGQGALVIQVNRKNEHAIKMVREINNATIENQVLAERRFMQIIGGGCRYPLAAHAEILPDKVIFRALSYKPEFNEMKRIKQETSLDNVWGVAENVAKQMLEEKI
ncbi:MAG: hydroxymethylbilane synthase [Prolixibacteraceae bacterium]|nr:hydroxymethylbilane synthase [Prolixibacteraceae bacterium]